jgi:hypothetical protein
MRTRSNDLDHRARLEQAGILPTRQQPDIARVRSRR